MVLFAFYIYYQKRVFGNIKPSINRNKSVLGRSRELVSHFCSTLYILYLRNTWVRKLLFFLKCSMFLLFLLLYCLFFFHSVLHLPDTLLSFIGPLVQAVQPRFNLNPVQMTRSDWNCDQSTVGPVGPAGPVWFLKH